MSFVYELFLIAKHDVLASINRFSVDDVKVITSLGEFNVHMVAGKILNLILKSIIILVSHDDSLFEFISNLQISFNI